MRSVARTATALALAAAAAADGGGAGRTQEVTVGAVLLTAGGRVSSDPAGIACPPTCLAAFPDGTTVTLRAIPAPGWRFDSWTRGDCRTTGSACPFVLAQTAVNVGARFRPEVVLRLRVAGSGLLTVRPPGLDPVTGEQVTADCVAVTASSASGRCALGYPRGGRVEIRAEAAPGFRLDGWSRYECVEERCVVPADEAEKRVTASFTGRRIAVDLNRDTADLGYVTSDPPGIVCPPVCVADFARDRDVLLTASVVSGQFRLWRGCSPRPPPAPTGCWLEAGIDRTTEAWFVRPPAIGSSPAPGERAPLEIDLGGSGRGSVAQVATSGERATCPGECLAQFRRPATVRLTAAAAAGSSFAGWVTRFCGGASGASCDVRTNEVDALGVCFNSTASPAPVRSVRVAGRVFHVRLRPNPRLFRARATLDRGGRRTRLVTVQFRPGAGILVLRAARPLTPARYALVVRVHDGVGCGWNHARASVRIPGA